MALGKINGKLRRRLAAGDIPGIIAQIEELAQAAAQIGTEDYGLQQVMANVEQAMQLIGRSGSVSQIDATCAALLQVSNRTPSPLLSATFHALRGVLLAAKMSKTAETSDLAAAVSAFEQAVDTAPESNPIKAVYQEQLLKLRGGLAALVNATTEAEEDERIEQLSIDGSERIDAALQARDPVALTAGIDLLRQALDLVSAQDEVHQAILGDIGIALRHRFELTGSAADLDAAVEAQQQAVDAIAPDNSRRASYLHNLATTRRQRFEHGGAPADLDAADEAGRQAIALCAADDPVRAWILSERGLLLLDLHRYTGSRERLDESIAVSRQAVEAAPDTPTRVKCLANLGAVAAFRFERLGEIADADAAVEATRQALEAAGPDDPEHGGYLIIYASALRLRGERTGSLADIEAAVDHDQQAVEAGGPGDYVRAMRMSHLGVSLLRRHELTGAIADLNAAVEAGYESVAAAVDDDPFRPLCFSNLSLSLLRRFERDGALTDLNAAVRACEQACDAASGTDPQRRRYLGNLANALQARFTRLNTLGDLDRAIDTARQAVAACPADDANRASYLNSLANALRQRFNRTAQAADLAESADLSRQALDVVPAGHPMRAIILLGLSQGLVLKFAQTRDVADLTASIAAARTGLTAVAENDPSRARFLSQILLGLLYRFTLTGAAQDLADGLATGELAAAFPTAAPSVRAIAAIAWGNLAAQAENWAEAVRAYRTAIELLERVAPRGLARGDQEHELIATTGVGSRAAACCLQLGDTELAAESLEHGRGVLLSQAIDTRTDLTALAEKHPDLAERFIGLRDALDTDPGLPASDALRDLAAERRRQLADDLDAVIAQVRAEPGFEKFLVPLTAGELRRAAGEGPVVLINVDEIRSDALVLTPDRVRHIALPGLSPANVREQVVEFLRALGELPEPDGSGLAVPSEERLSAVLGWLWDTVAGPVLDELGLTGKPAADQPWPRIWWSATGLLSLLPLHAAGLHGTHRDATPRTVLDRVVSSYTPTVRALTHSRRPAGPAPADAGRLLVVAAWQVEGTPELKYAAREVDFLRSRFGTDATVLEGQDGDAAASYTNVHAALPRFSWAHFACHAMSRLDDPSASHLVLPPDQGGRELSVTDIGRLNLQRAELAFLSACSTAQTGVTLPDEAINLAAGFQLAGYRRVVATMWPVDDRLAARIATSCYESLARAGTAEAAAQLLHDATRKVRMTLIDQPSLWAAHIHSGS
jgi:tetratricopeptide (TPR) repeat protein